jgi:hypothetical protein
MHPAEAVRELIRFLAENGPGSWVGAGLGFLAGGYLLYEKAGLSTGAIEPAEVLLHIIGIPFVCAAVGAGAYRAWKRE